MKESRKKAIIGIFIVFIMVSGGVGLFYGSQVSSESFKHRGLIVVSASGGWLVKGDNLRIQTLFNPIDLENIEVKRFPYEVVNSKGKMYISLNPNDNLVSVLNEITNVLGAGLQVRAFGACTEDFEGCEDLPIKTCENTNDFVLEIKESDEDKVEFLDNCIKLQGSSLWMARNLDKMVLLNYLQDICNKK